MSIKKKLLHIIFYNILAYSLLSLVIFFWLIYTIKGSNKMFGLFVVFYTGSCLFAILNATLFSCLIFFNLKEKIRDNYLLSFFSFIIPPFIVAVTFLINDYGKQGNAVNQYFYTGILFHAGLMVLQFFFFRSYLKQLSSGTV